MGRVKLPLMVGDWNCVLAEKGEKERNISTIEFVNKNMKPAYIGSYDMVKSYDRVMITFLLNVMERMGFPELF